MPRVRIWSVFLVAMTVLAATPTAAAPSAGMGRYIVTFERGVSNGRALAGVERLGGVRVKELPITGAAVVLLPEPAKGAVSALPGVAAVEPDREVRALAKPVKVQPAEVLPWGVNRIEADLAWATSTGDPVKVAVVDTGIDSSHPDLAVNLKGGVSTVDYTSSFKDDNGHGTHVAGIIAAADNQIGVVGVASSADLYAVKVLNRRGSGYLSDVIEGIEWSIANDMDVINMSLGTPYYSIALDLSVQAAVSAGVVVVAAAGNSGPGSDTVEYPGALPDVIAVAATDSSDGIASFSSRGPEVDLAAPGVSIYSTYKGASYATLSGTSMATPHVTGVAALVMSTPVGSSDSDGDGRWDVSEVRTRLIDSAEDLGPVGFDTTYGFGLVHADLAVAP